MSRFLDGASVVVLGVSLVVVIALSLYVGVSVARSNMTQNNVVRKTETERDASGAVVRTAVTEESSNVSNIRELFPLVEASLVFAGFAATVYQLRAGRRQQQQADDWKRAEFVTAELRQFSKDRSVVNCKRMFEAIDAAYEPRLMLEMAPPEGGPVQLEERPITKQELMNGLTPDPGPFRDVNTGKVIDGKTRQTAIENKIAYELDEYFIYMVNFRKLLRDGMLTTKDLHPHLYYWFSVIVEPQEEASESDNIARQARNIRSALHRYLNNYYPSECEFIGRILDLSRDRDPFLRCEPETEGAD